MLDTHTGPTNTYTTRQFDIIMSLYLKRASEKNLFKCCSKQHPLNILEHFNSPVICEMKVEQSEKMECTGSSCCYSFVRCTCGLGRKDRYLEKKKEEGTASRRPKLQVHKFAISDTTIAKQKKKVVDIRITMMSTHSHEISETYWIIEVHLHSKKNIRFC